MSNQLKQIKLQRSKLVVLSNVLRNQILKALAKTLLETKNEILKANIKDLKALKRKELKSRLELNEKKIDGMADSLLQVTKQPDISNKILEIRKLKNGLTIKKISVPLGTVGVIYESRPNVTIDLAGLAIKSGNALILKGGSEAYFSNKILVQLIHKVLKRFDLSENLVYLIKPGENWQNIIMNSRGLIDVLIPRGGKGLIDYVRKNARVPIIETGAGVCHIFVDQTANINKASKILVNAKTRAPYVCNALDTLVVHEKILSPLVKAISKPLSEKGVEIYADPFSFKMLKKHYPSNMLKPAKKENFGSEYLDMKMAIKTVNNFEAGLNFVQEKTSGHSEGIITEDKNHAKKFLASVDSATVYHNASISFTDGGEFGMGSEVGISTQKLHARGPMGIEALTTYKWIIEGIGQIRK